MTALWATIAIAAPGCRPELAAPSGRDGGGGSGGGADPAIVLEPPAPLDAAPLAMRGHLPGEAVEPDAVWFVEGDVGPGHLRQLVAGTPSSALAERRLPASVWSDEGGVWVAPHALLLPGGSYTIAVADRGVAHRLVASDAAPGDLLVRAWPPVDAVAALPRLVLCGASELPPLDVDVSLAPGGIPARALRGAASSGGGRRCLRVVAPLPVPEGEPMHPPPALDLDRVTLTLDPAPLRTGPGAPPVAAPIACEAGEVRLGVGCARVSDDRAVVRTPSAPLFWVVTGAALDHVASTAPGEPFVIHPLTPSAENLLDVSVADAGGREEVGPVAVTTGAPRPHVVLNEILADSVAPDATGEWIELVNDGAVTADLGALRILDVGGEIVLPSVPLAPGAFAVVVDADWVPDPALDAAPAPGTLVVRVPRLGRGGLANGGELIRLVDSDGEVVSAVPAIRADGPGTSTARREPWLADAPSSFVAGTPTPGSANAPAPP